MWGRVIQERNRKNMARRQGWEEQIQRTVSKKPSSEILRNEVGDTSWTMGRIGDFILNMMGDYWNMWKREGKYMMRFVLKIVSAVI